MRTMVLMAALLGLAACSKPAAPPPAAAAPAPVAVPAPKADALTTELWLRDDPGAAPGDLLAFLPGGSLLMTSCGETYRMARWQREGQTLSWTEDGQDIQAKVLLASDEQLQLQFLLKGGAEIKTYRASREARACPDLPR